MKTIKIKKVEAIYEHTDTPCTEELYKRFMAGEELTRDESNAVWMHIEKQNERRPLF